MMPSSADGLVAEWWPTRSDVAILKMLSLQNWYRSFTCKDSKEWKCHPDPWVQQWRTMCHGCNTKDLVFFTPYQELNTIQTAGKIECELYNKRARWSKNSCLADWQKPDAVSWEPMGPSFHAFDFTKKVWMLIQSRSQDSCSLPFIYYIFFLLSWDNGYGYR